MEYSELTNVKELHPFKRRGPRSWDLNIYRGCEHGCKYCYARYFHDCQDDEFFFDPQYRENMLKAIEKVLSNPDWKRDIVNIGEMADCYQPIEEKTQLMRDVLNLMIEYRTPVIITTKSDLILRDIDLLQKLSEVAYVNVSFTITTMDEQLRQFLEPNSTTTMQRLEALDRIHKAGISTGIYVMPIIPYLNDSESNLDEIYAYAKKVEVDFIVPGVLYLRGKTRPYFLECLKDYDMDTYHKVASLYKDSIVSKDYNKHIHAILAQLKEKYKISTDPLQKAREYVIRF